MLKPCIFFLKIWKINYDHVECCSSSSYEDSDWGWNDRQKRDEMMEDKARYLIARDDDGNNVAVSHFRYDLDNDIEILYW